MTTATDEIAAARPRRGEQLEVEIESLAFGGRGVARAEGYVVFVAGALPGDRVLAEVTKAKRKFAEARAVELLRAGADRVADRCVHEGEPCPGAPWQGLPYERQLAHKPSRSTTRCAGSAASTGSSSSRSSRRSKQWRYRNKLEYSFGERDGEVGARLPRPRPLGPRRRRRGLPAGLGARQRGPQRGPRLGAARGDPGLRPARPRGRPAQPRRPRGLAHRADPDPPGDLGGELPETAGRPPHGDRGRLRRDRRARPARSARNGCARSSPACGSRSPTTPSSRPTPRWPSASTRSPPSSPGLSGSERVFDLYCGIGTIGLSLAAQAGEVWGLELVPEAIADAERNAERNGIANARFVAGSARTGVRPLLEAGGQARRRRRRPAPRRPLAEDRAAGDRVRGEADRLRLLQPDHAGPERRPAHRGRL